MQEGSVDVRRIEDPVHTVRTCAELGGSHARTEAPEASRVEDLTSVRAWARSRGYPIDEAPGVPLAVLRTYQLVHAG